MWLLFPINQVIAIAVDTGRRVYKCQQKYLIKSMESRNIGTSGNAVPFGNSETYRLEKFFILYGEWANKIKISQDVPFNRFLAYTMSYIIYLTLLILILIFPWGSGATTYASIILFTLYVSQWISYDISLILTFKGKMFTRFWRVCSLLCHVFLVLSMIAIKGLGYMLPSCIAYKNSTMGTSEESLVFQANEPKGNETAPFTPCVLAETMNKTFIVTLVLGIYFLYI
jgi:hypothetical protein